ncbi:MAG: hypothetical protein ABR606_11390 [Vicinamibacterales bacterium]
MTLLASSPKRSSGRLLAGIVILLGAVVAAWTGFSTLFAALDTHGYGSPEVRRALVWMGLAGAGVGAGVCLLIWEISIRLSTKSTEDRG